MAVKNKFNLAFTIKLEVGVDVTAETYAEAEEISKKFKVPELVKALPGKELIDWEIDLHWITKDLD
jgi:hypothetical protein